MEPSNKSVADINCLLLSLSPLLRIAKTITRKSCDSSNYVLHSLIAASKSTSNLIYDYVLTT